MHLGSTGRIKMRMHTALFAATVALLVALGSLNAQSVRTESLSPTFAEIAEGFRRISGVRELDLARSIAVEILDDEILLIDWGTKSVRRIGRKGRGPNEYLDAHRVFPWNRDTSVLEDPNARKWLLFTDKAFVGVLNPGPREFTDVRLSGVDKNGRRLETLAHKYGKAPWPTTPKIRMFAESLVLVLKPRESTRADTIEMLAGQFREVRDVTKNFAEGPMMFSVPAAWSGEEQALLFLDGWIAIVRKHPYRVQWITSDGRRGPAVALEDHAPKVDEQQRAAYMAEHWGGALANVFTPDDVPAWPELLPPFVNDALFALPDGRLGIERTPDATQPGRFYDIVDRAGRLNLRLKVGARERIVGFGLQHIYTVRKDDDDLEFIRRHPWPAALNR